MAPQYTIEAINKLSDVEKMRFALAYLNHNDPKNVDWAAAATQSGSKSKESFKVMFNNTLKKLATASGNGAGAATTGDGSASTPKKRRKAATGDGEDAANEDSEAPKKRGRKKAVKKEELDADVQAEIDEAVAGAVKFQERSFFDDDNEEGF